jgi:hypothetical protein
MAAATTYSNKVTYFIMERAVHKFRLLIRIDLERSGPQGLRRFNTEKSKVNFRFFLVVFRRLHDWLDTPLESL